jgi:hypothetical protein
VALGEGKLLADSIRVDWMLYRSSWGRPGRVSAHGVNFGADYGAQNRSKIGAVHSALRPPRSLEQRTEVMREHYSWHMVATAHSHFLQIRTSSDESVVHGVLVHLFFMIGFALGITCMPDSQRGYGVGGLLADKTHAFRGKTDVPFYVRSGSGPMCPTHGNGLRPRFVEGDENRREVLAVTCEVKTVRSFPNGNLWYHGSRGIQVYGALWSGWLQNPFAPPMLTTPRQYKILIVRRLDDLTCACPDASWDNNGATGLGVLQFLQHCDCGLTDTDDFLDMIAVMLLGAAGSQGSTSNKGARDDMQTPPQQIRKQTLGSAGIQTHRKPVHRRATRRVGRGVEPAVAGRREPLGEQIWFVDQQRLDDLECIEEE